MNSITLRPNRVTLYRLNAVVGPATLLASIPGLAGMFITKIAFEMEVIAGSSGGAPFDISLDDGGAMNVGHIVSLVDLNSGGTQFPYFETDFVDPARIWIDGHGTESVTVLVYWKEF